jgi:chaperonin GroES
MKKTDIVKKILPLADRVLLQQKDESEKESKNKFGIIIPDTVAKEKSEQGVVVAVGEGRLDATGKIVPMKVKIGDTVLFSKYGYDEVKIDGEDFLLVKEENILAIIK